ncbi:MAG: N-acetylmuramoyl-L-alanine amidase [Polyangiaceae bacterium]
MSASGVASSTTGQTAAPAISSAPPSVVAEPGPGASTAGLGAPPREASSGGRARIERVEPDAEERSARIVLHASKPVRFHAGSLPGAAASAPRLYVDVDDAAYVGASSYALGGIVERVTLSDSGRGTRVLLELGGPAEQNVFYLPAPYRVVIDVFRKKPPAAARDGARRVVERVALDSGHGGHDPGAVGPSGIREKDVVLDIAHRAGPLLARELGVSTLLTRDKDQSVPLEQRVAKANAFGADLFISIHCNADPSTTARGVMAFVLDGTENLAARHVTARENLAPAEASDEPGFLQQFDDHQAAEGSLTLARLLQRASQISLLQGYPGTPDGGVHGAGFYVLAGARMPAVLFETSFISHPIEEARLGTARYRQKLADAIVNAVRAYREGY